MSAATVLDAQVRALLDAAQASGAPDLCDLPIEVAREAYRKIVSSAELPPADVDFRERSMDGPAGPIALRVYTPRHVAPRGAVLYLHGGGFTVGSAEDYDGLTRVLCERSGCVVVSPDYRLAPEHPFPAAVHDAHAVLRWLSANAGELGADPRRIVVAGDSAGGNLAAVIAILERDGTATPAGQILIYPVLTDRPGTFPSYERFATGYFLTRRIIDHFTRCYHGPRLTAADWRGAPLLTEDLSGLPPALVLVAGYDPLHDEGVAYAQRLREAGSHALLIDYAGLTHGFLPMAGVVDAARLALEQVAAAIRLFTSPR